MTSSFSNKTVISKKLGGNCELVAQRLRSGWSQLEATSIPVGMNRLQYNNMQTVLRMRSEGKTYREICEETGLSYVTVVRMIEKHLSTPQDEKVELNQALVSVLRCPNERLPEVLESLSGDELKRLDNQLLHLCQRAAFLSGYTVYRGMGGTGGTGHRQCTASGNKRMAKIRKALGFEKL